MKTRKIYGGEIDMTEYMKNVNINNKENLVRALSNKGFLSEIDQINSRLLPKSNKTKKWVECKNDCYHVTKRLMEKEFKSTAYMLRVISASMITAQKYTIQWTGSSLTGLWDEDHSQFSLESPNPQKSGRLIMGFGPSGSGKTYMALKIISIIEMVDPYFHAGFITIDGGITREQSLVYQTILKVIADIGQYDGISNLATSGLYSIYTRTDVMKRLENFYLGQSNRGVGINLYVPHTITECLVSCGHLYKKYIDITRDHNWIGLIIYQHRTHEECNFPEMYKCVGTLVEGSKREKIEGKKFSLTSWSLSYNNSMRELMQAPNYRFIVHNSGTIDRISTIKDLSKVPIKLSYELGEFLKKNKIRLLNQNGDSESKSAESESDIFSMFPEYFPLHSQYKHV